MSTPPRVMRTLARILIRGLRAGHLRDGLDEEFAERRAELGEAAARSWYRRQVLAAVRAWWSPESLRVRRRLRRAERHSITRISRAERPDDPPGPRTMDRLLQDLRFGLRALRAEPLFALMAIGALALGTGGATAIFTVVDAVLLRPLPYPEPDRIMTVWETSGDWLHNQATPANFLDWRARADSFSSLAALAGASYNLTGADEPRRLRGYRVTSEFLDVLGVAPELGRPIGRADDEFGAPPVALIGHDVWRTTFGSDPEIVGRSIRVDGESWTVIGVMPRGFSYPHADVDLWTAMAFTPEERARRNFRSFNVVGRLAPGVTESQAHDEMVGIAAELAEEYPDANESVSANVIPLRDEWLGRVQPTLLAMTAAVGALLLVACANVANLLLARAVGRREEVALRCALGAGPGRILQQALTESFLLGGIGAGAGMLLAVPGARFLRTLVPSSVPLAERVGVDPRAVLFSLLLAVGTTIVFGLAPALRASRLDQAGALRGARVSDGGGGFRQGLIVAQVALAVVLLVGAGLLVRSFTTVLGQELGFEPGAVLTARVELAGARYADPVARLDFYDTLVTRVSALPGAERAAMITRVPLGMSGGALLYTPFGQATALPDATFRVVTPGYFDTLGVRLRGRDFERDESEQVVIVSEGLAERHWPGQDPLGQRLKIGDEDSEAPWLRVIGVAADVRQWNIELAPRAAVYVPTNQVRPGFFDPRDLVVRAQGDPASLAPAVRELVHELDPELPVSGAMALQELVDRATASRRFQMSLLGAFAATAASIAMIGLYGLVSYSVQARKRELGIRLALGAARRRILGVVLRQGAFLVAAGLLLGLLGGAAATRMVSGMLYGVSPLDPLTFLAVPLLLAGVALAALILPARRASRIDPTRILRGA